MTKILNTYGSLIKQSSSVTNRCNLSKSVSYYLIAILVFQIYVFEFNIFTGAGTRSIGSAT